MIKRYTILGTRDQITNVTPKDRLDYTLRPGDLVTTETRGLGTVISVTDGCFIVMWSVVPEWPIIDIKVELIDVIPPSYKIRIGGT